MNSFLSRFKNPTTHIDQSIMKTSAAVVSWNRQHIAPILCEMEYCCHQGIASNGNRDDESLFNETSRGNFKELIILMSENSKI